jgi:hypothetical protein
VLPHGFGCAPAERRGAATVVGEQPLFALLCGPIPALVHHKPGQAAPQRATSACATTAHRRCRHDAASSMQEMPKLKAQLGPQARSACVVQTASLCTPLATCRIRRTLRPPSRAVSDLRLSRVRPSCAQEAEPVKLPAAPAAHLWRKAHGLCGRSPAQGRREGQSRSTCSKESPEDGEDVTQTAGNEITALHSRRCTGQRSTAWRT